jgi:hypothetical protein
MSKELTTKSATSTDLVRIQQGTTDPIARTEKTPGKTQLEKPAFDGDQRRAEQSVHTEPGHETRPKGTATKLHGKSAAAHLVPASPDEARETLKRLGYETSKRISPKAAEEGLDAAQLAQVQDAHAFLQKTYKDDYAEKLESQLEYLKDSSYELTRVSDKSGAMGIASGWHLGKTGFQIDYLSPMEFPREGSNDVQAGLSLMRLMASRHHASALWVEVDSDMKAHYAKAGFKTIAQPGGPEGLEMMVLPLTKEAKARVKDDPKGLWKDHVDSWYDANWGHLEGSARKEGDAARDQIKGAADRGQMIWIQALP